MCEKALFTQSYVHECTWLSAHKKILTNLPVHTCICMNLHMHVHKYLHDIPIHVCVHMYSISLSFLDSSTAKSCAIFFWNSAGLHVCASTCLCAHVLCAFIYIYIYIYMHICMYVHTHTHIYICIYICIHVHVCVCTYVYMHII